MIKQRRRRLLLRQRQYHTATYTPTTSTTTNQHYNNNNNSNNNNKMTMENVTCYNYTQPLDHFNPGSTNETFEQRYCIYNGYSSTTSTSTNISPDNSSSSSSTTCNEYPIFFYTGNESPIDEYVNNTGLIWELAPKFHALVVFVEHRFEGTSIPQSYIDSIVSNYETNEQNEFHHPFHNNNNSTTTTTTGCFTYLTTSQALADYASIVSFLNPNYPKRPVITFGGSYGGMLSAWMRILYGNMIAGSIASSAPIWGLPKTLLYKEDTCDDDDDDDCGDDYDRKVMDGASYVVGKALRKNINYTSNNNNNNNASSTNDANTSTFTTTNHCFENLLATWPLIHYIGKSTSGRLFLSNQFQLCHPLRPKTNNKNNDRNDDDDDDDVLSLLEWAQSPWFDLAEGDYPYPSSYIPYALGEGLHDLPAWPLQEACHHGSQGGSEDELSNDFGIQFNNGDLQNVKYEIQYGKNRNNSLVLSIDWNTVTVKQENTTSQGLEDVAGALFTAVKNAVSIWFNVTQSLDCFDVIPAINTEKKQKETSLSNDKKGFLQGMVSTKERILQQQTQSANSKERNVCLEKLHNETVWSSLVCNDNINLIMTYARGMGRDFYWPPSHPKDQRRYQDTVINRDEVEDSYGQMCSDPSGIFGYPDKTKADPYSMFIDEYYGGRRIGQVSNILFANGLLDPWSAAGVFYPDKMQEEEKDDESSCSVENRAGESFEYKCSMMQNITKDGGLKAILLELGGHHLDLMYSSDMDPDEVKVARIIQENHIAQWIKDWQDTQL